MGLKSKIIFVILSSSFLGACDFAEKQRKEYGYSPESYDKYQIADSTDEALVAVIYFLDSIKYEGNFNFDEKMQLSLSIDSLKIKVPYSLLKNLAANKVTAGVMHESDFTYFKINGGFIDDNYGLLYMKSDSVKIPGVISKRKLRESAKGGTWYFAETKL